MIIPARRTVVAAVVLALPLVLFGSRPEIAVVALAGDLFLLMAYFWESRWLRRQTTALLAEARVSGHAGDDMEIRYRLENRSGNELQAVVRQPMPGDWLALSNDETTSLPPRSGMTVSFQARPARRGEYVFPDPEVTLGRRSGWFRLRRRVGPGASALVYPPLSALREVERLKRGRGMALRGLRRHRQVGTGSEFERLRPYEPDDDFRHINWKTTARTGKPITNVYQSEKGRDVLICIDCGRMMGQPAGGGMVVDAAVEAAMVLARAVAEEGDRLGLAVFRDKVESYIPVKGGKVGARRVADALAGVAARPVHTSYSALAAAVGARQNRRSLVIVFTDFNDPQLASDLADAMRLLRGRHAAVVVGLRDPLLEGIASGPVANRRDLYRALAASKLVEERDTAARELRKLGVEVVECPSAAMTAAALDRYLLVKAGRFLD